MPSVNGIEASNYSQATHFWQWHDRQLPYLVVGDKHAEPVVLVHGFGGCIGHWRKNIPVLARHYRVYAIDLLGFGAAPKPSQSYTFELWGQQVVEFCRDVVGRPAVLVGNSIGAVVVMQAGAFAPDRIRSIVAIDCSLRLLHERKRHQLPWFQQVGTPLVQQVLNIKPIGYWFFNRIAQPQSLSRILNQAYVRSEAVTDELVELLLQPARSPGAADVFLAFISYAQGPLAEDLLPQLTCPVLMLWGEDDPWEPLAKARELANYPCVQEFVTIPRAGHCPMDEAADEVNAELERWLSALDALGTEAN